MSRESFLIVLAVLVMISPFLGLPGSWLFWLLPVLGLFVLIIGISLRRDRHFREMTPASHEAIS
jgi:hypothetical protein